MNADATPWGEVQVISYSWVVVPFAAGVSFVFVNVGLPGWGGGPLGLLVGIVDEEGLDAGVAAGVAAGDAVTGSGIVAWDVA